MNQLRFPYTLFCAALVFFLTSCGGSDDKTGTDTTDTTTNATSSEPAMETSTIVTTPQDMMIVRHRVANFAKWKVSYDEHDSMRLANGIHNYVIGRGVTDSNMVLVAVKVDDMAKAKAFGKDPNLKKAMQKGGVTGTPIFQYTTNVWQDTATLSTPVRSMTTFTVKDWTAWKNSFDSGKQLRMDNGLVDRVVGHDADDNKKVTFVAAIMDSAKANAFWKSDTLKKRRAQAGTIGQPTRFVFRVVQRY